MIRHARIGFLSSPVFSRWQPEIAIDAAPIATHNLDSATVVGEEALHRIEAVTAWIGRAEGRGRIVPRAPELGVERTVRTWEAGGELATRRIRIQRLLGSGLAGTVYLASDENGEVFIEKHYGEVPAEGAKKWGRKLSALLFTLFRQAPFSFRELPEAVIANHLINRCVVAASRARWKRPLTPPLLYTRYDAQTGGYVQAFAFVEGRPLRPWDTNLPLLGEAGVFFSKMRCWRDFLAKDLGLWGLGRQVDPANLNSYSNLWITPDRHVLLLDIVPGLPGFLELRYLWWGLVRGQLPPFGDAIDFQRLSRYLRENDVRECNESDLAMLRVAVEHWQNSEPRLWASPWRWAQMLFDPVVRVAMRGAVLVHLEVKGAISASQAARYRTTFNATGRFPKMGLHMLLKMSPLPLHLALTDAHYARLLLCSVWKLPLRVARAVVCRVRQMATFFWRTLRTTWWLLMNREARLARCREEIDEWIASEQRLSRLDAQHAARLRVSLRENTDIADLCDLFAIHLLIGALKHSLFGPSGLWLGAAVVSRQWWLAVPALVAPVLRVAATVWLGLWRRPGLLAFTMLPDIGVLAAPLYLLQRQPELGGFMLRTLAIKAALHVPGFGERGGLLEMLAVAAAQVLLVDPGRMLPFVFAVALFGVLKHWLWLSGAALIIYLLAIAASACKRWRTPRHSPPSLWRYGLPEPAAPGNAG